ncbi:hypothetical protein HPHPA5_0714 [Helicobacter pylori Hp A-5]|nr:hypothetical protein HPHPA5_0714 [Helicobacter pylori Hp A-5]
MDDSHFYDGIPPLLALLKGFYYTIRDISKDKAVLKGFVL